MRKAIKSNVTLPMGGQVKTEAVQTIIERMGITKAAIFLRETMSQPTDYLVLKEKLFVKSSAADIYAAIKAK
jgi:hypothetical protein